MFFLAAASLFAFCAGDAQAASRKYEELPLGDVRAEGWLKEMLVRQRDGITADLDRTYPQVIVGDFAGKTCGLLDRLGSIQGMRQYDVRPMAL